MRSFSFLLGLSPLLVTSAALADNAPLDASALPTSCASVTAVPADATSPIPALAAKISGASCAAEARFNALKLAPDDAALAALASAAKPSIEWLDAAIQQNDPTLTANAKRARADLFASMVIRMRNSIPAITMQTVGPALAAHDQLHAELEPKLKPWLDQAQ